MPVTHLPCGCSLQSASVLQSMCRSVPAHAAISIVGSHVVTEARWVLPLDSTTQPIFDETTGIPGSEGSSGSTGVVADGTGAIVTTEVPSSEDDDVCDAPAQPCNPSATRMEIRSESWPFTRSIIAWFVLNVHQNDEQPVCFPRMLEAAPESPTRTSGFFLEKEVS